MRASRSDERAWSTLITAANTPHDISALQAAVAGVAGRTIPCKGRRDQSAFVALQGVARAYVEGLATRRRRLEGCMAVLASECAQAAGWTAAWCTVEPEPRSWAEQGLFASA